MKKQIILFIIILGLTSCVQTKYFVRTERNLSAVDWNRNTVNYIPVMNDDLSQSQVLDPACRYIVSKSDEKLSKCLSAISPQSNEYFLIKSLDCVSKAEYRKAYDYLRKISGNSYSMIKDLLTIDLDYELGKQTRTNNYSEILHNYQELIDKYPANAYLKKIVALRIRYIRYDY